MTDTLANAVWIVDTSDTTLTGVSRYTDPLLAPSMSPILGRPAGPNGVLAFPSADGRVLVGTCSLYPSMLVSVLSLLRHLLPC